jgi:beta-glucosidase/6-phospho-beta-glucosidase/beta-galactosidase
MNSPVNNALFRSFFLAGFECSSHRRHDGRRLDLLAATKHDRLAAQDYKQLSDHQISTVRDGLRWHLIETSPGRYDWSSFLPMLWAARDNGTQVIWDLCHYGWPDDIDIWSSTFVDRFARYAAAVAEVVRDEIEGSPTYCPINEISFWAWAGGEVGRFNPSCHGRGADLKRQLVRASIAAMDAIRTVDPRARFITAEPLINLVCGSPVPEHIQASETYRLAQFEALDMLKGTLEPELGGSPEFVDIVGINYYPDNQWYHCGPTIPMGHHAYRPLSDMLSEVHERYGRPVLIAETGAEGSGRAAWLHYVCSEIRDAIETGIPVEGVCLYPILDYPGWENERTCSVGLLSDADDHGQRKFCSPFSSELRRQQILFANVHAEQGRRSSLRVVG